MRDALAAQDCLYTLVVKHPDGRREPRGDRLDRRVPVRARRPGGAWSTGWPTPATRIVSLTITEGGYHVNQVTGEFDADDPGDRARPRAGAPRRRRVFGLIVEALAGAGGAGSRAVHRAVLRQPAGNGDAARADITAFARLKDPELADWMEARRRVPQLHGRPDHPGHRAGRHRRGSRDEFGVEDGWPVVCEPFTQWVLEDHFAARPARRSRTSGVQVVEDVEPYELMKLRLLNASHQALCYLGYLAGYRWRTRCARTRCSPTSCSAYMDREGTPTLPPVPGVDLDAYRHQLIERFANPQVRDTLARLCAESSDRIPKWLRAGHPAQPRARRRDRPVGARRRRVGPLRRGRRRAGRADRGRRPAQGPGHGRRRRRQRDDPLAFLRDRDLFGDLVDDERFADGVRRRPGRAARARRAANARVPRRESYRPVKGRPVKGAPCASRC